MKMKVSLSIINSYKRLAYKPWHALAELIDNSTESFYNNREKLQHKKAPGEPPLRIDVVYNAEKETVSITDNAMGMSRTELESALIIGKPPSTNTYGRSKYGLGLKTSACWLGDEWTIRTARLGSNKGYSVDVDVPKVVHSNGDLEIREFEVETVNSHGTTITVKKLNRKFQTRTLSNITKYLKSMYRVDLQNGVLTLTWNGRPIIWESPEDRLLINREGDSYKQAIDFVVRSGGKDKRVRGWAGLLAKGSRADAGFSILHAGRVIKGWPESWRPQSLFGQLQGSNDLVNQRLVGELHFDDFEVSHTKDDIVWLGDEEDQVLEKLRESCEWLRQGARETRRGSQDERKPSDASTKAAVESLQSELTSPEISDAVRITSPINSDLVQSTFAQIRKDVPDLFEPRITAQIGDIAVKCYIEEELAPSAPYVTLDTVRHTEILIIVNAAHPHWMELGNSQGILNYLRHCVYDGIAEWQARQKVARIDPDTVKIFKDALLRVPMSIAAHLDEWDGPESGGDQ